MMEEQQGDSDYDLEDAEQVLEIPALDTSIRTEYDLELDTESSLVTEAERGGTGSEILSEERAGDRGSGVLVHEVTGLQETHDDSCFCMQMTSKVKHSCLKTILMSIERNYPRLQTRVLKTGKYRSVECLEISRIIADVPASDEGGPCTAVFLRVQDSGMGGLCVNGKLKDGEFVVFDNDGNILWDNLETKLRLLSTEYAYCAGISKPFYKSCTRTLRFVPQYINDSGLSVRSTQCLEWFKVRPRISAAEKDAILKGEGVCKECTRDFRKARNLDRNTAKFSPGTLKHRASPSSKYPVKYLSPLSVRSRYNKLRALHSKEAAKVKRYMDKLTDAMTVDLENEQSKELEKFVTENVQTDDVVKLLDDNAVCGHVENEELVVQESKKTAILKAFQEDQTRNRSGSHGNRWNVVTYRIALSIFSRSPQAYREINKWGIFQLPSVSSIRQYTTAYLQREGPYYEYLEEQHQRYQDFINAHEEDALKPLGEGVLILDEVKVTGKVMWNSKDGRLSGLAMDKTEFSSLADIFNMLDDKPSPSREPAQYVLQFLWRDMSSKFDVIGPHYTSAKTMTASFTASCLWDAIHAFQMFGFKVVAVVMDGASSNLAMCKHLSGFGKGQYGLNGPLHDIHAVQPWFDNPEFPGRRIFLMMCPTHQLKNMINSLWASYEGRAKALQYGSGKLMFGWKAIEDMWSRERARRPVSIRVVPGLVKSFIDRDSWTKLNVKPAKIMQQPQVLAELFSHANPDDGEAPEDHDTVMDTHAYLTACSKLFEDGFLKTGYEGRIYGNDSTVMQSILDGFGFFKSWMDRAREEFDDFSITSSGEKRFLAWQTYDLLRLMVYSFKEFCDDFLGRHPGYYVVPLKLNGSAVETLFSQFKAAAGGKLTSVNYPYAKRSKQLQREVRGDDGGYRNVPLYTQFQPLRKRTKKD